MEIQENQFVMYLQPEKWLNVVDCTTAPNKIVYIQYQTLSCADVQTPDICMF